jgi:hypothetical protein
VLFAVFKFGVAAVIVAILWRTGRLDLSRLAKVRVDGALLGVAFGQLVVMSLPLLRWHLLLRARNVDLAGPQILRIGLISYFALLFLPATGGQDAVRVYYANRVVPGRLADLVASVVVDRLSGLLAMCLLALSFGLLLVMSTEGRPAVELLALAAALTACLVVGTGALLWTKPRRLRPLIARFRPIAALVAALEAYRGRPRALVVALGLAYLAQLGNCISMYFAFRAVGAALPALLVFAATPIALLAGMVPLTPLGLGVVESAAEGLFAFMGSPDGAEASVLVRMVTALACLVSGLAFLWPAPAAAPSDHQGTGRDLAKE